MPDAADAGNADVSPLTHGSLPRAMLALAAPLAVTQLFELLYSVTDAFWVGRLGADAVSALAFSWPLVSLVLSVGAGVGNAGTILIARRVGAGERRRASHLTGQTLAAVGLSSVCLAAVGYALAPSLLRAVGATPGTAVYAPALAYVRVGFVGLPFTFGFYTFQSALRGWGDTRTPMYLLGATVALNVALDPFLVFGFAGNPLLDAAGVAGLGRTLAAATGFGGLGVAGAAVATLVSRGLATAVGVRLLSSGRTGPRVSLADLRPEPDVLRRLVDIGGPLGVEQTVDSLAVVALTALLAHAGTAAVAAYGVADRYALVVWLPTVAVGMAVETAVGQNLGRGRRDRAERAVRLAVLALVVASLAAAALSVAFARPIVALFVTGPGADAVVRDGAAYLRIVAPTWALMAVFHVVNGALCGAGATRLSMTLTVGAQWGLRAAVAAVLMLGLGLGAAGAWYGITLSNVVAALVGGYVLYSDRWAGDRDRD